MNYETQTRNTTNLITIITYIKALHIDPQDASINLELINGMVFSLNWKSLKVDCRMLPNVDIAPSVATSFR